MASLEQIDTLFSDHLRQLEEIISVKQFEKPIEFILGNSFDYKDLLSKLNFPGIYCIEIKRQKMQPFSEWVDSFGELWEHEDYKRKFVPNIKIKRVKMHNELLEWIPLYIGKSKNISKRVREHIELPLERNTSALKLKVRTNIYEHVFRVSTIKIDVKNYDLIVPQFENLLRERYNPLLGRK